MTDPRDEFTLLCESCGYVLEGLPAHGNCPECGRPTSTSSPARRPGSPWQRAPGPGSWLRTNAMLVRHPLAAMADARPEPSAAGLGAINILAAGLPFGIYAAVLVEPDDAFGWYGLALRFVLGSGAFLGASLGTAGVFGILTWIEHRGVRFFGGRRGWRVTHAIATTVCAHAAIGWLVSGLLWSLGMVVSASGLVRPVVVRPAPNVVVIHEWVASLPPALGLLAGLLVFEVLVYTGIRRNRFANRERPDAVQLAGPS